jgi:chemosensory pili system protein ChpA (sensor histidine kinase/response regulator)
VRGALRLVEVFGAALLVEEMEQLAQYLIDTLPIAASRRRPRCTDALLVQLPTYLERVMGGSRDMLVLLPLPTICVRYVAIHVVEGTLLLLNLSSDKQANWWRCTVNHDVGGALVAQNVYALPARLLG